MTDVVNLKAEKTRRRFALTAEPTTTQKLDVAARAHGSFQRRSVVVAEEPKLCAAPEALREGRVVRSAEFAQAPAADPPQEVDTSVASSDTTSEFGKARARKARIEESIITKSGN